MTRYNLADGTTYEVNLEKQVKCGKYTAVYAPEHQRCWKNGYIYAHRVISEIFIIDRQLLEDEVVHHIDHNGHNNSVDNLVVQTWSEHSSTHGAERPPVMIDLACDECGAPFIRALRQHGSRKGYQHSFCSRSCSGRHTQRLQMLRARIPSVS